MDEIRYKEQYDRATIREVAFQLRRIADTLEMIQKDIRQINERV